ncbi:MAG: RHS repeat domain-containing protein [Actinomycetota bacterium]
MRKIRNYRVKRPMAAVIAALCLVLWQAPPAAAFQRSRMEAERRTRPTQTPDVEQRKQIEAKEKAAERQPAVRELDAAEMGQIRGRGAHRNAAFNGVLPWQKSFRDVNLCNGNLFKSFTDIQVSPARGAGLAWQRSYNSNDERVGPFGVGWTHAYDIRINEAGGNEVPRTDFFGGSHVYHRDADGLYSPPAYMFDELSSNYDNFLADGPPEILSDDQKGKDGTVKHFMSGGTDADSTPSNERVIEYIQDRHGNQTVFTYGLTAPFADGSTKKLLTAVTDPSGRSLEISWQNLGTTMSPAWRITQVAGPFDSSSNPVYTVTYEYNGDLNLWKVHQDPNGLNRITTFTYTTSNGEAGLLASIADPLGHTLSYTYELATGALATTDTVWVSTVTEPGSGGALTWSITRDSNSWGIWTIWVSPPGTFGHKRSCAVTTDQNLRCFAVGPWNDVNWHTYEIYYDTSNNVTGTLTSWQDPRDWLTGFGGTLTAMTYGPHGNVLTASNIMDYAGGGVPILGGTTTTSYYDASKYFQKASVEDPNGNISTFDYFDNADTSLGNRGEVKWVRDARYGTTSQQFEYTYNQYGQKETETNLNDVVTEYTYGDTWGNPTQVVQDPGMGNLNRTTQMSYDVAGRVLSSTDPKSQSSSFTYNGVGQPTQATLPGETVSYTYGSNGRTESVTDGRGTTSMSYETGNDRVASVADPVTGTISYTYLTTGERASVTLPGGGTWTYTYAEDWSMLPEPSPDKISRLLLKIEDDNGRDVQYVLDSTGRMHEAINNITYVNGSPVSHMKTEFTFDSVYVMPAYSHGWLSEVKNTWNELDPMTNQWQQTVLVQNDYTNDNNGNRLTNTVSDNSGPIRTEEYGYDALSRLTGVDYGDGQTQTYAFDPMGNRTQKADSVTGTESYTYNNANMLLTRGSNSYTNDLNGNTLTGGGRTNTWDGQNRLTQCVNGSTTTSFVYGADGLRRRSTVGSTSTDYILEGQSVVRERQGGSNVATYLQGLRGPEYRRNDSTGVVRWYLYDGLGSVLGEVDGSGNITATRRFDVYGGVRASTGTSTSNHKFVGGLGHSSEDDTGFVYMRARYMDPLTGRFASEDPGRDGSNWLTYVGANPTSRFDPDGKRMTEAEYQLLDQLCLAQLSGGALLAGAGAALVMRGIAMIHSACAGLSGPIPNLLALLMATPGFVIGTQMAVFGEMGLKLGTLMVVTAAIGRTVAAYDFYCGE